MKSPRVKVKYSSFGFGCLVQVIGIILLFFFPIGTIIGVLLLIIGQGLARKFICSECKNRLNNGKITVCPTCKAELKAASWYQLF